MVPQCSILSSRASFGMMSEHVDMDPGLQSDHVSPIASPCTSLQTQFSVLRVSIGSVLVKAQVLDGRYVRMRLSNFYFHH